MRAFVVPKICNILNFRFLIVAKFHALHWIFNLKMNLEVENKKSWFFVYVLFWILLF